jgi:raffinose/stachyose/melibiose transport system permease protein
MIDAKDRVVKYAAQLFILFLGLLWIYPVGQMFLTSLKDGAVSNYTTVITQPGFYRYFLNSGIVSSLDIVLTLTVVTLAAYAFSKLQFPFKNVLFILAIIGMMIPAAGFIIPWFLTTKQIGLINNPLGLVGPHVAGGIPFGLLLIKAYFDEIPKEISEAATIDGCSKFRIFRSIILPLGRPVIATVAIYTFLGSWNSYILPLIFLQDQEMMTVTLMPQKFMAFAGSDYGKIYAALVMISLPIFLVYLFGQKYLERGLMAGSVK